MAHLIEVFRCGPHLLPGFIEQLNADAEELLPRTVMSEEHGVVVIAALISYAKESTSNVRGAWRPDGCAPLCTSQSVKYMQTNKQLGKTVQRQTPEAQYHQFQWAVADYNAVCYTLGRSLIYMYIFINESSQTKRHFTEKLK